MVQINFMQIKSNGIDKYLRLSLGVLDMTGPHSVKEMELSENNEIKKNQVFLKHKSKMTGDCSVFKFLHFLMLFRVL